MKTKTALDFLATIDPVMAESFANIERKSPEAVRELFERLYGHLYQRDGLPLRERFLVTIAGLISSGQTQAQFATQIRLALKSGITREELAEVALQLSIFSGFAHSINAVAVIENVADQLELES